MVATARQGSSEVVQNVPPPLRAALSTTGKSVVSPATEVLPATAPDEHQGVRRNAIDGPVADGMVEQREAGAGGMRELKPTEHLFPSLCFPPSVSLYAFLP